jgi:hypothetical protein
LAGLDEVKVHGDVNTVVLLGPTVIGVVQATPTRPVPFTELVITTEPVNSLIAWKLSVVEFVPPDVNFRSVRVADMVKSGEGTVTVTTVDRSWPLAIALTVTLNEPAGTVLATPTVKVTLRLAPPARLATLVWFRVAVTPVGRGPEQVGGARTQTCSAILVRPKSPRFDSLIVSSPVLPVEECWIISGFVSGVSLRSPTWRVTVATAPR